ncbi:MAG: metallopeptidase family protein [Pseudomonadota bacterium]
MDRNDFDAAVQRAVERLPDWVHEALDNVELLVLDIPDADMDPGGEGLLGLYVGIPLPERGGEYLAELPDVVYLFREAHLALGLGRRELEFEIERTLIHELAHYFGFDDAEIEELGYA